RPPGRPRRRRAGRVERSGRRTGAGRPGRPGRTVRGDGLDDQRGSERRVAATASGYARPGAERPRSRPGPRTADAARCGPGAQGRLDARGPGRSRRARGRRRGARPRAPDAERVVTGLRFDAGDPVLAAAAWSRLAEPGDAVAGALVRSVGAGAALGWLDAAQDQPARGVAELVERGVVAPGAAATLVRAVGRWQPRLAVLDPARELRVLGRLGGRVVLPGS